MQTKKQRTNFYFFHSTILIVTLGSNVRKIDYNKPFYNQIWLQMRQKKVGELKRHSQIQIHTHNGYSNNNNNKTKTALTLN